MGVNTKIGWTDHSLNFWKGCHKVSDGCKSCYMYRDFERYGNDANVVSQVKPNTITKVLKMAQPGDRIFTCSWSDFFIEEADPFDTIGHAGPFMRQFDFYRMIANRGMGGASINQMIIAAGALPGRWKE
jgi:hypothetical protein